MAIFKIQQIEGKPSETKKEEAEVSQSEMGAPEEAKELEAAKEVTGDKPVEDTEGKKTGEDDTGTFTLVNPKQEIIVKVDGPLGRVFTQALNKMLAVEGMAAMPISEEVLESLRVKDDTLIINVKAVEAESVTTSDTVEITNDVVKHSSENFVLAIESRHNGRATSAAALLSGLDSLGNTSIDFRVEKAADRVLALVKRHGNA